MTASVSLNKPNWTIACVAGAVAAGLGILLSNASMKVIAAALLALALLGIVPLVMRSRHGENLLIAALALSIPFSPSVNFFLFADHVGGASSFQIQAAGLIVLAFLALRWFRSLSGQSIGLATDWRIGSAILAYIATCALSLVNAFYPALALLEIVRLLQFFITFLIISSFQTQRSLDVFIGAMALGAIGQGMIAVLQYTLGRELGLHFLGEGPLVSQDIGYVAKRASGTIGHPNQLAYFFEILIPVFFAMLFAHRAARLRALCGLALLASLAGIMTTLSRGAWLTLPVSISVVFCLVVGTRILTRRGALVLLAASLFLFAGVVAGWSTIEKRFTANDHQSSASRAPLNLGAISVIEQHPVLGVGINNFAEVFHHLDRTGNARIFRTGIPGKSTYYKQVVHNMYLLVWAEVGTIGMLAFLLQFIAAFVSVIATRYANAERRALAIGIASGLAATLVHGLFDPGFKTTFNISLLVYSLLGVMAALNMGGHGRRPGTQAPQ